MDRRWLEGGFKKIWLEKHVEEAEAIALSLQMCYTDGAEGGKDTTPEGK